MSHGCTKLCSNCKEPFFTDNNRVMFCCLQCTFWGSVVKRKGKCWGWTGPTDDHGYGQVNYAGRTLKAHRVSFWMHKGGIFGIHVLHQCDNPPCTNPDHLFDGTQADNVHDMDRKGRRRVGRGERHRCAKLTNRKVRRIRARLAAGEKCTSLGREYGVTSQSISDIKFNKSWRHVQ